MCSLFNEALKNWDDTALHFGMTMDRKGCGKQLLSPEHFELKPSRFSSVKGHRILSRLSVWSVTKYDMDQRKDFPLQF
jgi:hypothetical protein